MREPVEHTHLNRRHGEKTRILGWPVEGATTALFLHHGLGEHIGRYQTFADALPEVAIWGYDARGHGPHTPKKGHADGLVDLANDLEEMIPVLLERSGAERVVLMGHSMGAAAVLTYLLRNGPHESIARVILSGSPMAPTFTLGQRIKVFFGRLGARLAPAATLDAELDKSAISSLAEERERYLADPLVHPMISLALARSIVDDAPKMLDEVSRLKLPFLLLHGEDDTIAAAKATRELDARLPDSRARIFAGARHEVHHDHPEAREAFFDEIRRFLGEAMQPPG